MELGLISTLNIFTLVCVLGIAMRELWAVRSLQSSTRA